MANQDFLTDNPSGGDLLGPPREGASGQRTGDRTKLKVSESKGFTLREAIRLLFKHKWILILPLIVIPPIGYLYAQTLTPVYVASARLQIQGNEMAQLLPEETGVSGGGRSLLNDQVLLLMSDKMLVELVQAMHLEDLMPIAGGQDMESDERVTAVVNQLKSRVLSVSALRNTRSISITAQWPENKDMPAMIANALAEQYVEVVKRDIEEAAETFTDKYQIQSEETERSLERINQEIEEFLREHSVASVEGRMRSLNEDLSRLRQSLWDHRNQIVSLEVEIQSIEKQLSKADPSVSNATSVIVNPEYTQAQSYLKGLKVRRLNELGRWKRDSPRIQNIDKQIEEAEERLSQIDPQIVVEGESVTNPAFEQLQTALPQLRILEVSTQRKIEALKEEEKALNEEIRQFGQVQQEYQRLQSEKNDLVARLRNEKDRIATAANSQAFIDQITDVRIADPARRPLAPSPTKKNTIILMSIAGAFAVGIGLAGMREFMNQTMETSDDVHKHLHLPVLGAIPDKVLR